MTSDSLFHQVWRRFRRHHLGVGSVVVFVAIFVLSFGASIFAPRDPNYIDVSVLSQPPSAEHLLGTDKLGRDILSRLLNGGQVSLTVASVAVSISLAIGLIFGLVSGYYGGRVDFLMGRAIHPPQSKGI